MSINAFILLADSFDDQQLFLILELEFGGDDLENMNGKVLVVSFFIQVWLSQVFCEAWNPQSTFGMKSGPFIPFIKHWFRFTRE